MYGGVRVIECMGVQGEPVWVKVRVNVSVCWGVSVCV